ncbi:Rz1-like spanin outer membrane subunit [Pseudomonas sp. B14(2017)]|uniref:Rz1-like spanin outer membrane subunit n=1 Tax=Pseudomonas sp. B14(2017) TaxID=1981745 RepID=UPI0035314184
MPSQSATRPLRRTLTLSRPALLLSFILTVSGCASSLQTPKSPQSQVVVDASLMATPSYQTDLLNFLSDKPAKPTTK